MRTTVLLDDDLMRQAKKLALETGQSFSSLISALLREALHSQPSAPPTRFCMATFGGKRQVHHEPADFEAVLAAEDHKRE